MMRGVCHAPPLLHYATLPSIYRFQQPQTNERVTRTPSPGCARTASMFWTLVIPRGMFYCRNIYDSPFHHDGTIPFQKVMSLQDYSCYLCPDWEIGEQPFALLSQYSLTHYLQGIFQKKFELVTQKMAFS
jgi:hypothetical protein